MYDVLLDTFTNRRLSQEGSRHKDSMYDVLLDTFTNCRLSQEGSRHKDSMYDVLLDTFTNCRLSQEGSRHKDSMYDVLLDTFTNRRLSSYRLSSRESWMRPPNPSSTTNSSGGELSERWPPSSRENKKLPRLILW